MSNALHVPNGSFSIVVETKIQAAHITGTDKNDEREKIDRTG